MQSSLTSRRLLLRRFHQNIELLLCTQNHQLKYSASLPCSLYDFFEPKFLLRKGIRSFYLERALATISSFCSLVANVLSLRIFPVLFRSISMAELEYILINLRDLPLFHLRHLLGCCPTDGQQYYVGIAPT